MTDRDALADSSFDPVFATGEPSLDSYADQPLWFPWRLDEADRKIPYRLDGRRPGWKDAAGRGTRAEAEAAAERLLAGGREGGVGVVLGSPTKAAGTVLAGLDLDTCRTPSGALTAWAKAELAEFRTYAEVSPSGTGLKSYFRVRVADLPALFAALGKDGAEQRQGRSWKRGSGKHPPSIELYLGGRWFAVTGNRLPSSPASLATIPRAALLKLIHERGPAFAAGGKAQGRSEHAMAIGNRMKRNGAGPEEIEETIQDDPVAAEWAADHDQRQIDRVNERAGFGAELSDMKGFGLNEDGIAKIFARRFRNELRYCHHRGSWYRWSGAHWQLQETRLAFDWVRDTCRVIRLKNANDPAARVLAKKNTAEAVEIYAQRDQKAFAVTSEIWDRDLWLLGTPAGTVDLRTGELRAARQQDFITKVTAVGPAGEFDPVFHCPRWQQFLIETTGGDKGMIRFLQQWVGYCLTGDTTEHALLFIFGLGGNGKGTFLNLLTWLLGNYALTAAMETFTATNYDRHPTELAALHGARFVRSSETEAGRAWAQTRIKMLTGGDPVTARFMRRDEFTYIPQFKLNYDGNHKPRLRDPGDAERRRFNIAPFDRRPVELNPNLGEQLKAEGSEILSWAIAGCLDWQEHGLIRPETMLRATAEYFAENDHKQQWLDEFCELGDYAETIAALRASWQNFTRERGLNYFNDQDLSNWLISRSFEDVKNRFGIRGRGFKGLRVRMIDWESDI